jgi:hypothetical protein
MVLLFLVVIVDVNLYKREADRFLGVRERNNSPGAEPGAIVSDFDVNSAIILCYLGG